MVDDKDSISTEDLNINLDNPSGVEKSKKRSIYDTTNPYEKYKKYKDPVAARYRKKMLANFFVSASIIAIIIIVFIAYIGSMVGNYTIELQRDQKSLTLSDEDPFFNNSTTRLNAESVQSSYCIGYHEILAEGDEILDYAGGAHNEYTGSTGKYMAYTFFLKNGSLRPVNFCYDINIDGIKRSNEISSEYRLYEAIRYRLYVNNVKFDSEGNYNPEDQDHNCVTYAYKSTYQDHHSVTVPYVPRMDSKGKVHDDDREFIGETKYVDGYDARVAQPQKGYEDYANDVATNFLDLDHVSYRNLCSIESEAVMRFSIIIWVEGGDLECQGKLPAGDGIQFSMSIYIPSEEATIVIVGKNEIEVDEKTQLTVNCYNTDNNNVIWSSSNEDVATVDSNGLVTGLKEGEAIIKAVLQDDSSVFYEKVINVTKKQESNGLIKNFYKNKIFDDNPIGLDMNINLN